MNGSNSINVHACCTFHTSHVSVDEWEESKTKKCRNEETINGINGINVHACCIFHMSHVSVDELEESKNEKMYEESIVSDGENVKCKRNWKRLQLL